MKSLLTAFVISFHLTATAQSPGLTINVIMDSAKADGTRYKIEMNICKPKKMTKRGSWFSHDTSTVDFASLKANDIECGGYFDNGMPKDNDPVVRRQFVRNIERAYMYRFDLTEISFVPLTSMLDKADPFFIRCVLYLLSMTFNREYIPLIEKHLTHPDETVREEAQYILSTW